MKSLNVFGSFMTRPLNVVLACCSVVCNVFETDGMSLSFVLCMSMSICVSLECVSIICFLFHLNSFLPSDSNKYERGVEVFPTTAAGCHVP